MTAPTETTTEEETAETAATEATTEVEKDWKAEFEAQQRINRDLERRSKKTQTELRDQLAAATTQKPKETTEKPEVDLDALRKQIRDETRAESMRDKALDKLEAKAARLFENPEDARTFLAGQAEDFIDGDKVNVEAITDALDGLLKERPYLRAAQGDAKRFNGTADAGPKTNAGKPQMSKEQMQKLYKEGKFEEVEAARKAGQLNDLLGIKS